MRVPHILATRVVVGVSAVLLSSTAVAQQSHNSNAPIDFGADHIELQDKANRAVLSGNVAVKQAEMTLNISALRPAQLGHSGTGR